MSILPHRPRHDGYYDDAGNWRRSKFCFVDCGERCTCMPSMGQHYSPAHDKRKQDEPTQEGK